ncbi:MAG: NAD-dependent epimerase/dehydratase family protein [Nocardioidaceae bacterium]|nr:NAD-dependent epimerase/dehydratase family protein [Nocardioidaceae bacterium]
MRIVLTGATGNLGTAVLRAMAAEMPETEVVAVARRAPLGSASQLETPRRTTWMPLDLRGDNLSSALAGADAVVHLAWAFHPAHRPEETWRTNVLGTRRLLEAAAHSDVAHVVIASSVAAYSPRRGVRPVDEQWPTDGSSDAPYAREKAYVERVLDAFEARHSRVTVTRLRPAFVFQSSAASEQRRIFAGHLAPTKVALRLASLALPLPSGLVLQAVHADDVGAAVALALRTPVGAALNLAADDVLDGAALQGVFGGRPIAVPPHLVRLIVAGGFRTRLLPADPRLLDAFLRVPMLASAQARQLLGWRPRHSSADALSSLRYGLLAGVGAPTPPLHTGP